MTDTEHRSVGPWRVHSARAVYSNPWIEVVDHAVTHPDGAPGQYGVVRFRNRAIGVLPLDDDGDVTLVGQHRFPLDRYSWELPEGGGALAEAPLAAARRELKEETGLSAGLWLPLIEADLSNSVTDEATVCFLAAELTGGRTSPESSEALALRTVPFRRLYDDVLRGEIRDSLTVMMTLAARARALRGEFPASICNRLKA
jgi:8-oxo-dGTP pyrophosphatase MutT (NUDIX family)